MIMSFSITWSSNTKAKIKTTRMVPELSMIGAQGLISNQITINNFIFICIFVHSK